MQAARRDGTLAIAQARTSRKQIRGFLAYLWTSDRFIFGSGPDDVVIAFLAEGPERGLPSPPRQVSIVVAFGAKQLRGDHR